MTSEQLTKELEKIFTIDGRGRPAKCKLFLELYENLGSDHQYLILKAIQEISQRKNF